MTTIPTKQVPRRETLNIRIPAEARALINRAAQVGGKTRTDFILESAKRAAQDALLDRTVFSVGADAYAAVVARLDTPVQTNERLRRTMQKSPP